MIDSLILKRLLIQIGLTEAGNPINEEMALKFANACAEYGKSQCSAGEWLDYPENKPSKNSFFLVENHDSEKFVATFDLSEGWYEQTNGEEVDYLTIKRFTEIKA